MDFDEPEDISEKLAALGEPKAEFTVGSRVLARNLILAPVLVLAGLGIEFLVFRFIGHSFELIMLGMGLVLTGVMLVVRAYRNRGLRVLVFAEGLVRVRGEEGQAMFWDEVDVLWRKKTEGHWEVIWKGSLSYLVQGADRKALKFDDAIPRLAELGRIIQRETFAHLWQRYFAAYEKGATLDFGKIRLSQRGISTDTGKLAWGDVQEVKFDENQVAVSKKGKWGSWFQSKVSEIPNYHVCKAIIERALATRATQETRS
jgi:hypothetical protein